MIDQLAAAPPYIKNQLIPLVNHTLLPGDLLGRQENLAHQSNVLLLEMIDRSDVSFGHDQEMKRGFGIDVLKDNHLSILIDDLCGHLFMNDFTEETGHINAKRKSQNAK